MILLMQFRVSLRERYDSQQTEESLERDERSFCFINCSNLLRAKNTAEQSRASYTHNLYPFSN